MWCAEVRCVVCRGEVCGVQSDCVLCRGEVGVWCMYVCTEMHI